MRISAPGFRIRSAIESAFSPDGVHLATVGRDVALWNVEERRRVRTTRLVKHPSALSFAPDGRHLLIKSTRGDLHLCATDSADPVFHYKSDMPDEGPGPLFHSQDVALDASWAGALRAWDFTAAQSTVVWQAGHTRITTLRRASGWWGMATSLTPEHPNFDAEHHWGTILRSTRPLAGEFTPVHGQWPWLTTFAFSPDAANVVLRYGTGTARELAIVCAETGVRRAHVADHDGKRDGVAWAPDGRAIVTPCYGGFSFRSAITLEELGWLPSLYASHVEFSADGRLISLGDWSDGVVLAWPAVLETLKPRHDAAPGGDS